MPAARMHAAVASAVGAGDGAGCGNVGVTSVDVSAGTGGGPTDTQDRLGKIFTATGHGGSPEERPDIYAKTDLLARLENITAPLLLIHGQLDRRVPFVNFELAVAELARLGKAFESHSYPDEGHGCDDPNNSTDMYHRLEDFFARHLDACGAS